MLEGIQRSGPLPNSELSVQPAPSPPRGPLRPLIPALTLNGREPGLSWEAEAPFQHHLSLLGDLGQVHPFLHSFRID